MDWLGQFQELYFSFSYICYREALNLLSLIQQNINLTEFKKNSNKFDLDSKSFLLQTYTSTWLSWKKTPDWITAISLIIRKTIFQLLNSHTTPSLLGTPILIVFGFRGFMRTTQGSTINTNLSRDNLLVQLKILQIIGKSLILLKVRTFKCGKR